MTARALAALLLFTGCVTPRAAAPTGIYFVMVDRFANGDPKNDGEVHPDDPQAFHGGDLQGVIDHLDWVKALGFDTVWLSPIFAMRTAPWHGYGAFHGYWTWELGKLEPRFGDELLLAQLRRELDRRGMKLYLDLVLNHVGPDAPLLTAHPDWFHRQGGVVDFNDPKQATMGDVHGLPDLATEQPEVFDSLVLAAQKWVELAKPEGFRLDAVKHLPLEFWANFNSRFPQQERLGELLDGDPSAVAITWHQGKFTQMFDFPLAYAIADVFCRGQSPVKLAAALTNDRRYPDPNRLVTLLDNHDLPRIVSQCHGDQARVREALTFVLSMRGIPSLTWGTEVALDGVGEPDNRKSMRFDPHPFQAFIAQLMKRRAASPALSRGVTVPLSVTPTQVVFARIAPDGSTVHVTVKDGHVTIAEDQPRAPPPPSRSRSVLFTGAGVLVGSGPELGDWNPKRGRALPVTLDLPLHGVFEFKRQLDGQWEPGPNRVLFVTEQTTSVSLDAEND